ncbi:hypothetical protein Tco_1411653 [Tanacetum coccineum]
MPCWQSLSFPKAFSMAEIVYKEAQSKSKAGICFSLSSHNKHTCFYLYKEAQAANKMANENVPAHAPTRSDDQILPFAVAFTTSATVPAIYIQQFWNMLTYVEKAGTYQFQLDENWFTLDANLLREALEITPIDQAHPFMSPPSGDAIMDFVNELGYPEARLLGMIGPDIQFFRCFRE